jgi:hypothetical protein
MDMHVDADTDMVIGRRRRRLGHGKVHIGTKKQRIEKDCVVSEQKKIFCKKNLQKLKKSDQPGIYHCRNPKNSVTLLLPETPAEFRGTECQS